MKKVLEIIDYLLVIIAVVVSYYFVFTRDNQVGLILKDASIIITITLPYFIEKLFHKKVGMLVKTSYIIFIFVAQFLGVTVELYNSIAYFDKFTHWLSGIGSALFSLIILDLLKMYKNKNLLFNIIWMIAITLSIATLWECFEYIANIFFGGDAQRVALTGVNDTMQDILVALLGSILVSFMYIYEEVTDRKLIVKSFIN